MKKIHYIFFLFISLFFISCEDVIDIDLSEGKEQLVIDAFLTDDSTTQTIRLTESSSYFSNVPNPPARNVSVKVVGPNNVEYAFVDDGNGNYNYEPGNTGKLDSIGFGYKLILDYKGKTYTSISILNPSPVIDSITYESQKEEINKKKGYYTQFFARDFPGRNDFYWIKSFKNDTNIIANDPSRFNLSQNAAFSGDGADGFIFIQPIRNRTTDNDNPYQLGDEVKIEIWSINESVMMYLQNVSRQANNGGLFATPTANVRSNINDIAGNYQEEVLGVFSLSSISRKKIIIQ